MRSILVLLSIIVSLPAFSQLERKYISKGTDSYNQKLYKAAEDYYRKALEQDPESYKAAYNIGNALYKQGQFEKATKQFESLLERPNSREQLAQLYHNIGNSYLEQNKLDESIEAYKKSLRNSPGNSETQYNLSFAMLLKQQQEQQNQNQQCNNPNQNQNQDQNQDQQNQGENQQNDKNYDDADGDGIPDDVEKGENPGKPRDTDKDGTPDYQDTDTDNDGLPDEHEAGANPSEPKDTDKDGLPDYRDTDSDNDGTPDGQDEDSVQEIKMSKEDAERLLKMLMEKEQETLEKVNKEKAKQVKVKNEKDW